MKKNDLLIATGGIPATSKKVFKEILTAVVEQWKLSKPVDIMTANRLVSTWMKLRYVEKEMAKHGLIIEEESRYGKKVKVSELAYYLKQLDSEFRAYYRLIAASNPHVEETESFAAIFMEDDNDKVQGDSS